MKIFSPLIAAMATLLFPGISTPAAKAASPFALPPTSYLLQVDGETVRQRNADLRHPPASLTKIMTALIVLEQCDLDEAVTVSRGAARETGSRIGLRHGDKFRVRDLLAATLIASANDACRALADHVCGTQKIFVARMNDRARELHLKNTRFTNACGHDSAGLYSTANDLAILTGKAMRERTFAQLVARHSMRIRNVKGNRSYFLHNKNRLIGRYPGALGVKTGTTPNAGKCLVALAQRKDRKVLLVMMNAKRRWQIAPAMLDAAFEAGTAALAE